MELSKEQLKEIFIAGRNYYHDLISDKTDKSVHVAFEEYYTKLNIDKWSKKCVNCGEYHYEHKEFGLCKNGRNVFETVSFPKR